jgi:hypothetical protein
MDDDFPEASGVRTEWSELPERVSNAIEKRLGARVISAETQRGGFSPGLAARCELDSGERVFLKAADPRRNPHTPDFHRNEARISAALPREAHAPQLNWHMDVGGWAVLCFECVDGTQPQVPWVEDELTRVIEAIDDMSAHLTPTPVDAPSVAVTLDMSFRGFRCLVEDRDEGMDVSDLDPWVLAHLDALAELEAGWADGAHGETLLHCDLRADNILLTEDRVVVVDWPHVCVGAAWFDLMGLLPSVGMQGHPDLEALFRTSEVGRAASPAAVDAALAGLAGYFVCQGRTPPPRGIPTVREFQLAQGRAAVTWLRQRLGW